MFPVSKPNQLTPVMRTAAPLASTIWLPEVESQAFAGALPAGATTMVASAMLIVGAGPVPPPPEPPPPVPPPVPPPDPPLPAPLNTMLEGRVPATAKFATQPKEIDAPAATAALYSALRTT